MSQVTPVDATVWVSTVPCASVNSHDSVVPVTPVFAVRCATGTPPAAVYVRAPEITVEPAAWVSTVSLRNTVAPSALLTRSSNAPDASYTFDCDTDPAVTVATFPTSL